MSRKRKSKPSYSKRQGRGKRGRTISLHLIPFWDQPFRLQQVSTHWRLQLPLKGILLNGY